MGAAVAEVLGHFGRVGAEQRSAGQRHAAQLVRHHLGHLALMPWPISVPPWFTSTLPSAYTCTKAPARLRKATLKLMPNLTGVKAMPRLSTGLLALKAAISARRSA